MLRRTAALAMMLVIVSAHAPDAHAGPGEADPRVAARALAQHGQALYEAGKYREALAALENAERLFHAPTLVFSLGRVNAAMGKLVEARALFQKVRAEKLGPEAPKAFRDVQRSAPAEIAALDARIPTLAILVRGGGGKGLRVSLDDVEIPDWAPDRPVPADPGVHRVSVVPLGGVGQVQRVELAEGQRASITIELAGAAPARVSPALSDAPAPRPWRVPAYVSYGVGGAGLALGVVAAILTGIKSAELNEACPAGRCPTSEHDAEIRLGRALGVTSTVGFVVAGAGAALGTVLLLARPGGKPAAASIGIGPGAVLLSGRF